MDLGVGALSELVLPGAELGRVCGELLILGKSVICHTQDLRKSLAWGVARLLGLKIE